VSVAALYTGRVDHTRLKPIRHHLSYAVFMGLFDIDRLAELPEHSALFGYNRTRLISFYDRDHGDGSATPLRAQVESKLAEAGVAPPGGAIRLLCMPRVLGGVFNPLSIYFCYDKAEILSAVVHEVHNTYGERHFYALPAETGADGRIAQACEKTFRVSPLTPMQGRYQFNIAPLGETAGVSILMSDAAGPMLTASFKGSRRTFTSANILRECVAHPALSLKVVAGIHWEALITWIKLGFAKIRPAPTHAARASGK